MTKLSYKERARLRREQDILKTAARMIRDHGYINLNMDELAEEVGISKPTLYQHFKGKDDMVARTMVQTMREMEAYLQQVPGQRAIDKLENVMRYMMDSHTDPDGLSVAIVRDGGITLQHLTRNRTEMREIQQRVTETLYTHIDQAKADGHIRAEMANMVVVGVMFASLSILRGPEIMEDFSLSSTDLIDHIVAFFRRGVAPQTNSDE